MQFSERVLVVNPSTNRAIEKISSEVAADQYRQGIIEPRAVQGGFVWKVARLDLAPNTVKPGSFGINRLPLGNGSFVYQHKNTHEEVLKGVL
jgi:hypothetical protein